MNNICLFKVEGSAISWISIDVYHFYRTVVHIVETERYRPKFDPIFPSAINYWAVLFNYWKHGVTVGDSAENAPQI